MQFPRFFHSLIKLVCIFIDENDIQLQEFPPYTQTSIQNRECLSIFERCHSQRVIADGAMNIFYSYRCDSLKEKLYKV